MESQGFTKAALMRLKRPQLVKLMKAAGKTYSRCKKEEMVSALSHYWKDICTRAVQLGAEKEKIRKLKAQLDEMKSRLNEIDAIKKERAESARKAERELRVSVASMEKGHLVELIVYASCGGINGGGEISLDRWSTNAHGLVVTANDTELVVCLKGYKGGRSAKMPPSNSLIRLVYQPSTIRCKINGDRNAPRYESDLGWVVLKSEITERFEEEEKEFLRKGGLPAEDPVEYPLEYPDTPPLYQD